MANIALPYTFAPSTVALSAQVNANLTEIRDKFNTYAVQTDVAKTITVAHTWAADLLFTDALYDIGKSGATRPRDLFLSRNLTLGGLLVASGAGTHTLGNGSAGAANTSLDIQGQAGGFASLNLKGVGTIASWQSDNATKWQQYMTGGDPNLYLRDLANTRMQMTHAPGASSALAVSTVHGSLNVESTYRMANAVILRMNGATQHPVLGGRSITGVGNNTSFTIDNYVGFAIINLDGNEGAIVKLNGSGNAIAFVYNDGNFSSVIGTASKINIVNTVGVGYTIENKIGATRQFNITLIGG